MRTINIALFGTGTVGSGVIRIIQEHHDDFMRHCGVDLNIAAVTSRSSSVAESLGLGSVSPMPRASSLTPPLTSLWNSSVARAMPTRS